MKNFSIILLGILFSFSATAQKSGELIFTIEGMKCEACVNTATQILLEMNGVKVASVDLETKSARVTTEVADREKIREKLAATGFVALFDGEELPEALSSDELAMLDFEEINTGRKLDLETVMADGKITLVYFHARWCASCKVLSPVMERMLLEYPEVAYRKVDIIDWRSDLARQLTKDFELRGIPFVAIFDENGKILETVTGNHPAEIRRILGD